MYVRAANLRFDEPSAEGLLCFFDAAPDVPIALVEIAGCLLDRSRGVHGLKDFTKAEPEGVVSVRFQPDLDARDQAGREAALSDCCRRHE